MSGEVIAHIKHRIKIIETDLHGDLIAVDQLESYIQLLAHWNRRINLTSLQVDPPTDEAIDRLIIEPVIASWLVHDINARIIDLGSGGGSPALPFRIQLPDSRMTMIESRSRKCAFLREAVRQLNLKNVQVEETRFEGIHQLHQLRNSADIVTLRAVRLDRELLTFLVFLLAPGGRVFRFIRQSERELPNGVRLIKTHTLVESTLSELQVLTVPA